MWCDNLFSVAYVCVRALEEKSHRNRNRRSACSSIAWFFWKICYQLSLIREEHNNYKVLAQGAPIFHGFHIIVSAMPPLRFRSLSYIWLLSSTRSCPIGGSTISSPLFSANIHILASSCIALKICFGVLKDLLNT